MLEDSLVPLSRFGGAGACSCSCSCLCLCPPIGAIHAQSAQTLQLPLVVPVPHARLQQPLYIARNPHCRKGFPTWPSCIPTLYLDSLDTMQNNTYHAAESAQRYRWPVIVDSRVHPCAANLAPATGQEGLPHQSPLGCTNHHVAACLRFGELHVLL